VSRVLRLAFLTDIHVQPERGAAEGFAACLRHVHALPDPPDLLLNGGDAIMDAVATDEARAQTQWNLFDTVLRENNTLPIQHCLGNHDIWGWNRRKSGCTGQEPLFGKQMALRQLGMASPYYRFDRADWRFLVLDSSYDGIAAGVAQATPASFIARLDDAQFAWLAAELIATPTDMPVVVVSHCPIVAGASLFFTGSPGETERTGDWVIPAAWMHIDARAIVALLLRFPNVRLCLSGHTHVTDRLDFCGITFLNYGAVAGRWWRNTASDPPPTYSQSGYGLIDLHADGTFTQQFVVL
jgi:3',5'-cyclic-AMP phosphodiesterase